MKKVDILRKKYPRFIYEKYFYKISGDNLEIFFEFKIKPDIYFRPKIIIENVDKSQIKRVGERSLNNLAFHLGLMEIPSYWKATCSPEIKILAGFLNKEQNVWWKDLILKGMGQFFYENRIDWRSKNFLTIKCENKNKYKNFNGELKNRYLVPFAGGRDSIVTLESLKKKGETALFLVNPNEQIKKVVKVTGVKKQIIVKRIIDKKLLELNKKGYLNGHTPFTALLSFLSVLCAVLFDYKHIVFSNEKSADEGNVKYLGKMINHQWAKSSEFERKFKYYCKKYLAKNINYFSYLRKYTELEIVKIFTKYPKYFSVFSSCNVVVAKKMRKRWCGNCPKCLFVYMTLYPFLNKKELLKIFGKDIFETPKGKQASYGASKKLSIMKQLLGKEKFKPFECVGTTKESRSAFRLSQKKAQKSRRIPYLLTKL